MAGKQGYGRSPELSLKSMTIFSSTFEGSSHLERPERRFFSKFALLLGAVRAVWVELWRSVLGP